MDRPYTPLSAVVPDEFWPEGLFASDNGDFLDSIACLVYDEKGGLDGLDIFVRAKVMAEARLELPFLDGMALVLGTGDGADTGVVDVHLTVEFHADAPPDVMLRIETTVLSLAVDSRLLRPVEIHEEEGRLHVEITSDKLAIPLPFAVSLGYVADDWVLDIDAPAEQTTALSVPKCMIGDTGVVIEALGLSFNFDGAGARPPGSDSSWRGLYLDQVSLWVPSVFNGSISVVGMGIGTGGFYGDLHVTPALSFNPHGSPRLTGDLAGEVFGIEGGISDVSMTFVQNVPTRFGLSGTLILPFFDAPIDVVTCIDVEGSVTLGLSGQDGLAHLELPNVLELDLTSIGLEVDSKHTTFTLGGRLTPLLGADQGLEWPTFEIEELSIDSNGNVALEGGWLDLRNGYTLDFFGFEIEITKLGFGKSDDGGQWMGFSGGIQLAQGITAGASVEGLRIVWYADGRPPKFSLEGAGVEFLIPDVLSFKGAVSFRQFRDRKGRDINRFDGRIAVNLLFAGFEIDAQVVFGMDATNQSPFMAIALDAQSPVGYPLGSTGLALYGIAGLFAAQMKPDKLPEEAWYSMSHQDDWFHREEPGVSDLTKWEYEPGAFALGAGVTMGTLADNGYTFSGKLLLVVVIPGPVILLEGRANLLKERSKLSDEPAFHALAVLDMNAREFLVGLDAKYAYDDKGSIIDIAGSTEMYFSFKDPTAWHLYIGKKDPKSQRIKAEIFNVFDAHAWFMLDNGGIDTGMWVGWDWSGGIEIVNVDISAFIEGGAMVSFRPVHFAGYLGAYGMLAVNVFGFGFTLELDARLEGEIDQPSRLLVYLSFKLDLPWPFDDVQIKFNLRLGPTFVIWPPLPLPLQEVAVEHFLSTTSWPLLRVASANSVPLLRPNLDVGKGNRTFAFPADPLFVPPALPPADADPPDEQIPVVPVDSRPHITFNRPVHDVAFAGVNLTEQQPEYERIGDPSRGPDGTGPVRARYSLMSVTLQRRTTTGWQTVAGTAGSGSNPGGTSKLYGSWAPTPRLPSGNPMAGSDPPTGNTKLWVYSKDPFDYTRRTTRVWDDWFNEEYASYPCPPDKDDFVCYDFEKLALGAVTGTSEVMFPWRADEPPLEGWLHPAYPNPKSTLMFSWFPTSGPGSPVALIQVAGSPVAGIPARKGLGLDADKDEYLQVLWPFAASKVRVVTTSATPIPLQFHVNHGGGGGFGTSGPVVEAKAGIQVVTEVPVPYLAGFPVDQRVVGLQLRVSPPQHRHAPTGVALLHEVCVVPQSGSVTRAVMVHHLEESLQHFSEDAFVFEANSTYRLKIETQIEAEIYNPDDLEHLVESITIPQTEFAYFRTEGPPGFANLWLPAGTVATEDSALHRGAEDGSDELQYITVFGTDAPQPVLQSELNRLGVYVAQTMPPTLPMPGQQPWLPRPVYRAYDVGVEFKEDYVASMYRRVARDLTLQLLDSNDRPVRDAAGRLLVFDDLWVKRVGVTESTWSNVVSDSPCLSAEFQGTRRSDAVSVAGYVLTPDSLYQGRLVPLLFADDFSSYGDTATPGPNLRLGPWQVFDTGTSAGSSQWRVESGGSPVTHFLKQTSSIHGPDAGTLELEQRGTLLLYAANQLPTDHPDRPAAWSDLRLHVKLRVDEDGYTGIVFRHENAQRWYRFSLGSERCRLVRALDGNFALLAEAERALVPGSDYRLTLEALGGELRAYVDGELVVSAHDESLLAGSIGLYASNADEARFSELRVEDLRDSARQLFRFSFVTSCFANFAHQIHSHDGMCWPLSVAAWTAPAQAATVALPIATPAWPSEAESRAFEETVAAYPALADAARALPARVETTLIASADETVALLLMSPEPIDWRRVTLSLEHAPSQLAVSEPSGAVKLIGAERAVDAGADRISLVVREATNLAGHRIEVRRQPLLQQLNPRYHVLTAFSASRRFAFQESFREHYLDAYVINDAGGSRSAWQRQAGAIVQSTSVLDGALSPTNLEKRGTLAVVRRRNFSDARITVRLRTTPSGDTGIVFRHRDPEHYYRVSINHEWGYVRLVACERGRFRCVAERPPTTLGAGLHDVSVQAVGSRISVHIDGQPWLDAHDAALKSGSVGLYAWFTKESRFEALRVENVRQDRDLGTTVLSGDWSLVDVDPQLPTRPSVLSPLRRPKARGAVHALAGEADLRDYSFTATLARLPETGLDVLVRYQNPQTFYAFRIEPASGRIALRRHTPKGSVELTSGTIDVGLMPQSVRCDVMGDRLVAWLDGVAVLRAEDRAFVSGRAGFAYLQGAEFEIVEASVRAAGSEELALFRDRFVEGYLEPFEVVDRGGVDGPSDWRVADGVLTQHANIRSPGEFRALERRGSHALAGDATWRDYVYSVRLRSDDDDVIGVVFRYTDEDNFYRFELDRQVASRRLVRCAGGEYHLLWESDEPSAYEAGRWYELSIVVEGSSIEGYLDGVPMFSVSDATLPRGKIGLFSWANRGSSFAKVSVHSLNDRTKDVLLRERFEAASPERWQFVSDPGAKAAAEWRIELGRMIQMGHAFREEPREALDKRGTLAVTGAANWTDYHLRVILTSDHDNDAIGVVFRYVDADNYYRFSMDADRRYRRLVKVVGGRVQLLWQDTKRAYKVGRSYLLAIDAVADRLELYLDGSYLGGVNDATHASGKVGLYAFANAGARFERLEVLHPSWQVYKTFTSNDYQEAGTEIWVSSLPPSTALPAGGAEEPADAGAAALPSMTFECRLVDATGKVIHRRSFLPEAHYVSTDARILRNADGTRALVLPPSGTWPAGSYRFSFSYRRAVSGSPNLSQNGDSRDEHALLEVTKNRAAT